MAGSIEIKAISAFNYVEVEVEAELGNISMAVFEVGPHLLWLGHAHCGR